MDTHNPLITTVIPTYRRPHLLKRAIKSVLNQTFKNLQVCVYDNASSDQTREVVESLAREDNRVKYFCHDTNIGSQKNFRFGLDRVNTSYFSFLSDDDFLFPEFYQTGIEKLLIFPEAALFAGNYIIGTERFNILSIGLTDEKEGLYMPNESLRTFIYDTFVPWTTIIFNTAKVKKYCLEDSFKISDLDYNTKIMCNEPIIVSKKYCGAFLKYSNSISTNLSLEDVWPITGQILEKAIKTDALSDETKRYAAMRWKENMTNYIYQRGLKSILLNNKEKYSQAVQFLEKDFNKFDLVKKLKFFNKIKIISFLGPVLLMLRNGCVYISNKRFYSQRKSLLNVVRKLK